MLVTSCLTLHSILPGAPLCATGAPLCATVFGYLVKLPLFS